HRKAAPARAARLVQVFAKEATGPQVGAAFNAGIDVDVLSVALAAQADALRAKGFELAADAVEMRAVAGERGIDPARIAGHGRHHADGGAVFDVRRARVIPFGIAKAGAAGVGIVEFDPGAGGRW